MRLLPYRAVPFKLLHSFIIVGTLSEDFHQLASGKASQSGSRLA